MNVLSLFDGMSCAQIALNKIGIKDYTYYSSEIDEYAIIVTMKNYPNTIQIGDVKKIKGSDLPKIDLLVGGSPCQGFSFAGLGLNFSDERSALFFEYVRVLKELKKLNPNILFLLENVRMKKEHQDVISEQLGVEPIKINSNLVSAQNRVRMYWTNIIGVEQPIDKKIYLSNIIESGEISSEKSMTIVATIYKENAKSMVKRKKTVVKLNPNEINSKTEYRKLTVLECERLQTVPDNYTNHVSMTQRYKMLGNGFTVDVIAHILKGMVTK
jgi:site-specific DNA-cytosine methylase